MQFLNSIGWAAIISNLGLYTLLLGAATWLTKALAEQYLKMRFRDYEKRLETTSADLKMQLDAKLEAVKADLNLAAAKNSKLHEKRMLVLESLYQKIVVLNEAMKELTAEVQFIQVDPVEEERSRVRAASEAYREFLQYYKINKIFFSSATCAQIETLQNKYFNSLLSYRTHQLATGPDSFFSPEKTLNASETIRRAVPPVLRTIEQSFRDLLGVQD